MSPAELPRITVLLATYNGRRWLPEQLDSILSQTDVVVRVVALDDESTDGTGQWLAEAALTEPRLTVLAPEGRSGSAAANFFRLLARAPVDDADFVALSDQDDVWLPGKLARHARLMREHGYDGVSSNVTSFSPDGRRTLIRKDYPQREFDFLTESPGPGCTFLLSPRLVSLVRDVIAHDDVSVIDFHDSLIYAIARSRGWQWHIDGEPTVDYRQHDANVMGSNVGAAGAFSRFDLIRRRWHRNQAILMGSIGLGLADDDMKDAIGGMLRLMTTPGPRARSALAARAAQLRRRPRDARIIGALIASGIW